VSISFTKRDVKLAPDESCLFDVYQEQCVPGTGQDCPDGFGQNGDYMCVQHHDVCRESYHSSDGDETGQCYSNERGRQWESYVLIDGSY
jgi:hypothetical protein